ncbi:hypothetical protein ACP70R_006285 [Stipagrostis hirtigluma subsp. patula]
MAEEEEQTHGGGAGAGGGEEEDSKKKRKYPIGFRFKPKDEELVEFYLLPRLQGRKHEDNDAIIEANVYECQPDTLINEKYKSRGEDEWFFLSPRARMYQNGVRPSRKTEDGRGRWKASTATTVLAKEKAGKQKIQFCKNVLNYFQGCPKNEYRTKWLMRELTIPEYEVKRDKGGPNHTLDEYVLCRIYVSPVNKGRGEEASTSSAGEEASEPQDIHGTAESELSSERRAGKRPAEEQLTRGWLRKQPRQQGPTIGSSPAFGAGYVAGAAGYYGAPGQAPLYNGGVKMQRPPAGGYNGQVVPVQPPAGAYNGQATMRRPPTPTQFPPRSAARTNPNSMMMRPSNMAGQWPLGYPGNPPRRHPGTGYNPPALMNRYYDQGCRAMQPPGNAPYGVMQQQQQGPTVFAPPPSQQQRPYIGGNASHHVGAIVPLRPPYQGYPYQCGPMAPPSAAAAANTGSGSKNAEQHFVELASINMSLAPRVEPRAQIGAAKLEAEMEETSSLHEQGDAKLEAKMEETSTSSLHEQDDV